ETQILEIVVREPDGRVRAAQPGETGEVVVTDLHNLACPMIRYVNGDLALARAHTTCACGRQLAKLGPVEGRVTETLRDGRGDAVSGLVFNILFGVMEPVAKQFQVVQKKQGDVVMRVIPTAGPILPDWSEHEIRKFADKYLPGSPFAIE